MQPFLYNYKIPEENIHEEEIHAIIIMLRLLFSCI